MSARANTLSALLALAAVYPAAAQEGKADKTSAIVSIRVWSQPEVTRVIVELSQAAHYRTDRLSGPPRFFLDIPNSELRLASSPNRRAATTPVNDRWLLKVRSAETEPGRSRVVFDLASEDVGYSVSELTGPPRIVVEFRAKPDPVPESMTANPPSSVAANRPAAAPARAASNPPPPARITLDEMRRQATTAAETKRIPAIPATQPSAPQAAPPSQTSAAPATRSSSAPVDAGTPPAAPTLSLSAPPAAAPAGKQTLAAAAPARRASKSLTRTLGLKLGKIVLDPGHGGHDVGTTSPGGLLEKDLVLDLALRLGQLIEDQLGAEVAYTRRDDTFVPLEKRAEFANQQRADLFVSIHANSSRHAHASGPETFFLSFTSSAEALEVASRENATSGKTIFELEDILKKIALNDKLTESREFAEKVQASLMVVAGRNQPKLRDRGVKRAPFVVLIGTHMPSILAEAGFMSNQREEALLRRPEYRQKLAEGLLRGITQYADSLARFQVARRPSARPDASAAR
jgi:N-acetylmuramoyl-L-alanine amidase